MEDGSWRENSKIMIEWSLLKQTKGNPRLQRYGGYRPSEHIQTSGIRRSNEIPLYMYYILSIRVPLSFRAYSLKTTKQKNNNQIFPPYDIISRYKLPHPKLIPTPPFARGLRVCKWSTQGDINIKTRDVNTPEVR